MNIDIYHIKNGLVNLAIEARTGRLWDPDPKELEKLVDGLELLLIDRDALRDVLLYLGKQKLVNAAGIETPDESDDDQFGADIESVLVGGLGALLRQSRSRFARMVADPHALMCLREAILDSLTPYWWEKVRGTSTRLPMTDDESWEAAVAEAGWGVALAEFETPTGPRHWVVTATLESGLTLTVEFTLLSVSEGWTLEVDLLDPPLVGRARWEGRLVSSAGVELGRAGETDHALAFCPASADLKSGLEIRGEYVPVIGAPVSFRLPVYP